MTKIDHEQQLVLAKTKKAIDDKKKKEFDDESIRQQEILKQFIIELDRMLSDGISIKGFSDLSDITRTIETYGQATSELLSAITSQTSLLAELTIPDTIRLKQITDPLLLDALKNVGDNGELLSKIQTLDKTIGVLRDVIIQNKTPKQGQTPNDYIPVRVVEDVNGKLGWLSQVQTPSFVGVGGNSGGLTNAELRASPVPVSASIDTTGLATSDKQDTLITYVDGIETLIAATNSALNTIDGRVDGLETLVTSTNTKLDTLNTTVTSIGKPTDAYSICAISDDGTYKYYFFEDASLNYYVMRKTISTNIFLYTKGTGGYASVYQSAILGPSGSPTFASYGNVF